MFGKRKNFNDFMREFDSMFDSTDSFFGYQPKMIFGATKTETGHDENGSWTKQTFTSDDGSTSITNFIRTGNSAKKNGSKIKTQTLQELLNKAVEEQNYEEAVKLRDEIKKIEKNKDKIESLKNELDKSIKEQNYEKAIEIRDELKKLEN